MRNLAASLTLALSACLATAPALAQDVELYEEPRFAGMRLSLVQDIPDLAAYSMAGRIGSVIIHRGRWEFCTQTGYRGSCLTVGPGHYAEVPSGLHGSIVSLRSLRGAAPGVPQPPGWGPPGRPPWQQGNESVLLYASSSFAGEPVGISEAINDLSDRRFNDQARAVEILRGRWQLCQNAHYGGECQILDPGRHVLQGRLAGGLSSLRPLDGGGSVPAQGRADLVLYESSDFRGNRLPIGDAVGNLSDLNFNDRARAIEVLRGRWQLCHRADFGGECQVFGPGRHVLTGRLADGLTSLRPVDGSGSGGAPAQGRADVVLYESSDFRGNRLPIDDAVGNLGDLNFNDRARAIEVLHGRWQLCHRADFGGECQVFGPGRHVLTGRLAGGLSSLRPTSNGAVGPAQGRANVVLFEHGDFRGQQLAAEGDIDNLGDRNFNDRASSIEVLRGQWEFCTDAGYQGDCFVLGPGRYNLERRHNDRISSLRPLSRR